MTTDQILDYLETLFPDAHCELDHQTPFQLLVAVVLSAQTTDAAVNKVTPTLFEQFPDATSLTNAKVSEIEQLIKRIGLYHSKARNIHELSCMIDKCFHGEVPSSMKELTSLPGVGRKTANVVRSVAFDIPSFAVDTHVSRISKRLGLAKVQDDVEVVEMKCKRKIRRDRWNRAHHLMIFFGRYHCTARNPKCDGCPFVSFCKKDKLEAYRISQSKKA